MTKSQASKKMAEVGIKGSVSGKGQDFTVEVSAKDAAKFRRLVAKLSGYKTGYGTWVFSSEYVPAYDDNYCSQPKPLTSQETLAAGVPAAKVAEMLDKGIFLKA